MTDTSPSGTARLPFEVFTITDPLGFEYRATRVHLGNGIYRTPDDPTCLQDLIDARFAQLREREVEEQIEQEFRTLPAGS